MATAAVFSGPGRPLEIISVARPDLREGELLVQVLACSLCRSDLHSHAGRRSVPVPSIIGHEIVGRIEAFGPRTCQSDFDGQPAVIGDRITWSIVLSCGRCFFCERDLPQKCRRLFKYGHEEIQSGRSLGGGLAEFVVLLPGTAWLKLPDAVPDSVAPLANCAAATAAAVLRYAGSIAQQRVIIVGAGVLGTIACAMAITGGARQVLVTDPHAECLKRATQFGATGALDAAGENLIEAAIDATDGIGADVVLDMAGNTASVRSALSLVRTGGTVILAGTVAECEPISVDPQNIVRRMITLRGVHNYHPQDLQAAVTFLANCRDQFPFSSLIGETYPLDQAENAFLRAHSAPGVRIAVVPARIRI